MNAELTYSLFNQVGLAKRTTELCLIRQPSISFVSRRALPISTMSVTPTTDIAIWTMLSGQLMCMSMNQSVRKYGLRPFLFCELLGWEQGSVIESAQI